MSLSVYYLSHLSHYRKYVSDTSKEYLEHGGRGACAFHGLSCVLVRLYPLPGGSKGVKSVKMGRENKGGSEGLKEGKERGERAVREKKKKSLRIRLGSESPQITVVPGGR